jgi:signal transduction histidine kinase
MPARALRSYLFDGALALALAGAGFLVGRGFYFPGPVHQKMLMMFGDQAALHRALLVWWLFAAPIIAGLVVRRRWPVTAFVLVGVGAAGHVLDARFDGQPLDLAVPLVLYTVASLRSRSVAVAALATAVAGEVLLVFYRQVIPVEQYRPTGKEVGLAKVVTVVTTDPPGDLVMIVFAKSFQVLLILGLAMAIGDGVRSRRAHLRVLEQRAADLEREQQQREALAAVAERARITRELHDVVAHGLSVMVVQAQGAAAALSRHPDRSATALQQVIGTGRASLADMRRLLGMARRDPSTLDDACLAPQPGVGALPALVDRVRAAGTPVRLDIDGEPVSLPASVELSAYRIVQEALTNTLKHAGPGARAAVRVAFAPDRLEVEVTDDGSTVTANGSDGNGLRGIAERVGLLGGELSVGRCASGGFRVHAQLPVEVA